MKHCETCRWADDNGQAEGTAICRIRPPVAAMAADGKGHVMTVGMFPPVRLAFDGCKEHDDSEPRPRIQLAQNLPSVN